MLRNKYRATQRVNYLALFFLLIPLSAHAALVPADRQVAWQGNVGVEGGIPNRTTIRNCVTSDAVPTNATTDATTAIRTCMTNTPADGVAFLPAGTYRVTGTLNIPANKTLRGAGANQTILSYTTAPNSLINIGSGSSSNTLLPISSGYTKGSTQLTLTNASSINPGDLILINELNDTSIPVSIASYAESGGCPWCDQFGGARTRAQVVKVLSKSTNTLTLAIPFFYNFSASRSPMAMKINTPVQYAGVEDLTVKNTVRSAGTIHIMVEGAANSWIKGVKADTCGERCIDLRHYFYRIEVRDSLFTECVDHDNSDTCYGTEVAEGSSSLIENNIYFKTSNGPILMWGASGNVVAYNYIHGVYRTRDQADWMWPNTWTHGSHPSYNVWEGNYGSALNWDGYWGSASHNTAFRNRFTSKDDLQPFGAGTTECAALLIEDLNTYATVIGNVLGLSGWSNKYEAISDRYWSQKLIYGTATPGPDKKPFDTLLRHRNYDYFTNGVKSCGTTGEPPCQGSDGTTTLPASLYLSAKPAFFGSVVWPPIGPDVSGLYNKIPAQVCFEQGSMPGCLSTGSPLPPPPPPPSGSACDINGDSSTNVTDVQLCANQAIGVTACSTGDINHDSQCNVIDVQRVVNAALGGQCVTQ